MINFTVFLRSLLAYILGWVITLFFGTVSLFFIPFRKTSKAKLGQRFIIIWITLNHYLSIKLCNLNCKINGLENKELLEKNNENYVVISNHQSAWETIALFYVFKRVTFLLKKELLLAPFFGWGLALLNPVSINRHERLNAIKILLEKGKKRIEEGYIFIAFPEGTRQAKSTIGKYHFGSIKLAQTTGVKILPVVHNAGNFWSSKSIFRKPGTIQLVFGEPIDSKLYKTRELTESLESWSREQLNLINQSKSFSILPIKLPQKLNKL